MLFFNGQTRILNTHISRGTKKQINNILPRYLTSKTLFLHIILKLIGVRKKSSEEKVKYKKKKNEKNDERIIK